MNTKLKIARYQFEDSVKIIQGVFIANLFLIFLIGFPELKMLLQDVHMQACLITAVLFFAIYQFYDWKSKVVNIFFVSLYLLILGMEWFWGGFPDTLYPIKGNNIRGAMLDIFVFMLPIVYILLRLFLYYH